MFYPVVIIGAVTAGLCCFGGWGRRRRSANKAIVLEAVVALTPFAYNLPIQVWIIDRTGRSISAGEIYAALAGLESEGLVGSTAQSSKWKPGDRQITYFPQLA